MWLEESPPWKAWIIWGSSWNHSGLGVKASSAIAWPIPTFSADGTGGEAICPPCSAGEWQHQEQPPIFPLLPGGIHGPLEQSLQPGRSDCWLVLRRPLQRSRVGAMFLSPSHLIQHGSSRRAGSRRDTLPLFLHRPIFNLMCLSERLDSMEMSAVEIKRPNNAGDGTGI